MIRNLSGMDEFFKAEDLQRVVWGRDDTPDPADLMMAIQQEGGLVGGAFDDEELVGYVFGFPTRDPKIQHSHRLAVSPKARGCGLAVQLKQFQRSWCLERGIELVRWTFDPLRHINANLNVGRLGASCSTYLPDYYGPMKGINAGLASDRLVADWQLMGPRVVELVCSSKTESFQENISGPSDFTVKIPENLDQLLVEDKTVAMAARVRVREQLTAAFEKGYVIAGYDASRFAYVLKQNGQ